MSFIELHIDPGDKNVVKPWVFLTHGLLRDIPFALWKKWKPSKYAVWFLKKTAEKYAENRMNGKIELILFLPKDLNVENCAEKH